jgi:hypothetical protein
VKTSEYFRFDRSCTIYCSEKGDKLHGFLEALAPELGIDVTGKGKAWTRIAIHNGTATITLNRSLFVGPGFAGPGRAFNKIILGTGNFFKDVPSKKKEVRKRVLDHIYGTVAILGCVAEPNFESERGDYGLLFAVSRFMKGMIFDGQGMLDAFGVLAIDKFGHTGLHVFSAKETGEM